jgi:hypothetical protein
LREGIDGLGVGTQRQWSMGMQSLESVIHLWNPPKPAVQPSHLMSLAAGTFLGLVSGLAGKLCNRCTLAGNVELGGKSSERTGKAIAGRRNTGCPG